jgi:hypothetical protein
MLRNDIVCIFRILFYTKKLINALYVLTLPHLVISDSILTETEWMSADDLEALSEKQDSNHATSGTAVNISSIDDLRLYRMH